jgi:hypothetical protein
MTITKNGKKWHASTPAPHTAHARTRSPSRTRLTAAEPSPPVALLPRSYKKFVKYLSKELKANGKAFDFTIAGAKWASQEEGHEFKFEFGEAWTSGVGVRTGGPEPTAC